MIVVIFISGIAVALCESRARRRFERGDASERRDICSKLKDDRKSR